MDEATDSIDNRNHTVLQYEREKRKKIEISTTSQNNQQNVWKTESTFINIQSTKNIT